MGRSQRLYNMAKRIIPGGTQLLSKNPDMLLPDLWPAYYSKARGCEVWDLDGRKYTDMSYMGIGSCILGYADRDVDNEVKKAVEKGSMSTLNCHEEVELSRLLCDIHPWAKMARFARTGGEAMAMAVRVARAKTEKDIVLFCGYHGWHDWYLSANLANKRSLDGHLLPGLAPLGVPRGLYKTAIPFDYNDIEGFLRLTQKYKSRIAAVVMEPIRNYYPRKGFLEKIRKITKDHRIVLIFDEITSGWRLCGGGAHLKLKVYPDVSVFAKAMSNGYPMAAIIGREEVMYVFKDTFISSTYWTEKIGPVAALATIRKMRKENVSAHVAKAGREIRRGWERLAKKHGLPIKIYGIYPLSHFSFDHKEAQVLKTLFTQLMLEKGFLATTAFYASFAHKESDIKRYLYAADKTFSFIARTIKEGKPARYLKGPVSRSGFARLT